MKVRISEERLKEIEEIERNAQMSFQFPEKSEADENAVGESVKCYHCELSFPTDLATYFPFGMSGDPFRPLCQECAAFFEGEN